MIESIMYFCIGFCAAGLIVPIVVPLVHARAVRLTTRRLEGAIPSSLTDVVAAKDLQRADFAISTRRLELKVEELRNKHANELAEVGRKTNAINMLRIEIGSLRDQLRSSEESLAAKANAAHDTEQALAAQQSQLATLGSTLAEHSGLAGAQQADIATLMNRIQTLQKQLAAADNRARTLEEHRDSEQIRLNAANHEFLEERARKTNAINQLRIEIVSLHDQLRSSEETLAAKANTAQDAEQALAAQQSQLATLGSTLAERSRLADSQQAEIAALMVRIQTLQEQLAAADNRGRTLEEHRDSEHIRLEAANHELVEERAKFTNFHDRIADLVRQVIAQTSNDRLLSHRTQEKLERHVIEQSRLLKESERDREHLRKEIELARKAEARMRAAVVEGERRADAAVQNLNFESARLQGALDRANGERTRLAYELARLKRQTTDSQAA